MPADLLVILTTVDGVVENFGTEEARLLHVIERIDGSYTGVMGLPLFETCALLAAIP